MFSFKSSRAVRSPINVPTTHESLTALFRKLGAPEPDSWASSQSQENIPQLQRYLFLREAWKLVIPDADDHWIDACIGAAKKAPEAPYAGVGLALEQCLSKGASRGDLTDIARGMQAELLFGLLALLDNGPQDLEEEVEQLNWGIFETDEHGKPVARISELHDSMLGTDPTGREMRPK